MLDKAVFHKEQIYSCSKDLDMGKLFGPANIKNLGKIVNQRSSSLTSQLSLRIDVRKLDKWIEEVKLM